jgi:hypothetical protein
MKFYTKIAVVGSVAFLFAAGPVFAAYIIPRIGGGKTVGFPMIMPEIFFDGQRIHIFDENQQPFPTLESCVAPVLRALEPPDEFDPSAPWFVLTGKAYNFQYGWDSAYLDEFTYPFPAGSGVWVQVLEQSPELETYYRDAGYAPIFGTKDSSGVPSPDIWYWDKGMRHNTYAVPEEYYGRFSATYKVYLGDRTTGAELVDPNTAVPRYGSSIITCTWMRPCPVIVPGDIDRNCIVDLGDFALLAGKWLSSGCSSPCWCDESDMDHDTVVGVPDAAAVFDNWLMDGLASPSE